MEFHALMNGGGVGISSTFNPPLSSFEKMKERKENWGYGLEIQGPTAALSLCFNTLPQKVFPKQTLIRARRGENWVFVIFNNKTSMSVPNFPSFPNKI